VIDLIFVVVCFGVLLRQHLKIRELKSDKEVLEYKLSRLTKPTNASDSALMLGRLSALGRGAERKRGATTVQRMREKARQARETNLEGLMSSSNVVEPYSDSPAYSYDVDNLSDSYRGLGGSFSGSGSGSSWSDSGSSSSSSSSSSDSSSSSSSSGD
jgi:hypothetical protein